LGTIAALWARTQHVIRLGAVALAVALPLTAAASAGGGQSGGRCATRPDAASRVHLANPERVTIVNVPRERSHTVKVPESEAGDYPYNIVRRAGCFVVWSYVNGRGYTVFALDSRMRPRRLASHTRLFLPSSKPNRIWVMLGDRTHPWDGRLRAVREVSVSGQVTVPGDSAPGRPRAGGVHWPVATAGRR
jgi:hypothetical protein